MRYLLVGICLLALAGPLAAQEEPEIVIELTGTPDVGHAPNGLNIWDKNAQELTKQLAGKTREQALYLITSVSTKDANVQAADKTRYRFVQYGREGGYRKLLFRAKEPQTFVACATNTQEALELSTRYQVNLGITESEFLETYAQQASSVFLPSGNGQALYQLNTPGQEPRFFLFERNLFLRELNKTQVEELLKPRQQATDKKTTPAKNQKPTVRKALLQGGTVTDQMYMPRVTGGPFWQQLHTPSNERPAAP